MWRFVKVPKAVAMLAFLLPWMTVSCSNTKVAEATGWELMLGRIRPVVEMASRPSTGHLNLYFIVAVTLISIGLILAMLPRKYPRIVLGTSLVAMAMVWAGANQYSSERIAAGAAKEAGDFSAVAASVIHVEWRLGYWLALGSLGAAAVIAILAMIERAPAAR